MVSAAMARAGNNRRGRARLALADHHCRERTTDRDRRQQRARGVGELRCLADFEALDPRDAGDAGRQPPADRGGVDDENGKREPADGTSQCQQTGAELGDGAEDEDASQLLMLGVNACSRGMDDAGADRRHCGDGQAGHPCRGRRAFCSRVEGNFREVGLEEVPSPGTARVMGELYDCRAALGGRARRIRAGRSAGQATTGRDR